MPVNQPTNGIISTFNGLMGEGSSGKLINQRHLVNDILVADKTRLIYS